MTNVEGLGAIHMVATKPCNDCLAVIWYEQGRTCEYFPNECALEYERGLRVGLGVIHLGNVMDTATRPALTSTLVPTSALDRTINPPHL